jgi:hypothetical protein
MTTIHISNFVRRQTPQSGFSHWTHTDEALLALVQSNLANANPGYRDGVILVPVSPEGFYSSTVSLQEGDVFVGEYVARKAGEDPRKSTYVVSRKDGTPVEKIKAANVYVVLYSHAVLAENNENDTDADYEIISVNASADEEEAPIPTGALIANHFQLSGGTATGMTDSEFVAALRQSVLYWKDKSLACPEHLQGKGELSERLNVFAKETVENIYKDMEKLGANIRDDHGKLIPNPQNDQEKIMFLAGQVTLALFLQGATS